MARYHSWNVFNFFSLLLTLLLALIFVILLWHSLTYLRDMTARIVYIVRIASKRTFQKYKKKLQRRADGSESEESEEEDLFYSDLKENWKREIYRDRSARCCRMLEAKMFKYNYHCVCCFRGKYPLSQYDLLKPSKHFRWLLLMAQLSILWFISILVLGILHIGTHHDARLDLGLAFLLYMVVVCLFATPFILFIIWALWRHYLKTVGHALTTGNKTASLQRREEYIVDDQNDSLEMLDQFLPAPSDLPPPQDSRGIPQQQQDQMKSEALRHSYQPQTGGGFYESGGPESDRHLMDRPHAMTFHPALQYSGGSVQKNLSKIDEEGRGEIYGGRHYGPFATDKNLSPRVSADLQNSHNLQHSRMNVSHNTSQRQPVRYSSIIKPKQSFFSLYVDTQNGVKVSTRAHKVLWDMPVPRIRGYYSRLSSNLTIVDGMWYGIAGIIFFILAFVACFQVSFFTTSLSLLSILLFICATFFEMLVIRNIALVIIAAFHHCCYKQRKDKVERVFNVRFNQMGGPSSFQDQNYNKVPLESEEDEGERARLKKEGSGEGMMVNHKWGPGGDQKRRGWITSPCRQKEQTVLKELEKEANRKKAIQKKDGAHLSTPMKSQGYSPIGADQSGQNRMEKSSPLRIFDLMENKKARQSEIRKSKTEPTIQSVEREPRLRDMSDLEDSSHKGPKEFKVGSQSQRYNQKDLEEYDRRSPGKRVSFIDPVDAQAGERKTQAGSVQPIPKPMNKDGSSIMEEEQEQEDKNEQKKDRYGRDIVDYGRASMPSSLNGKPLPQREVHSENERLTKSMYAEIRGGEQSGNEEQGEQASEEVVSFDRRQSIPLEEIFAVQNPVSELNDLNLLMLDQIKDAFDDKTQDVVKAFRGRNFLLPHQEDDLCDIRQFEEPNLVEEEEQPPSVQVRVYREEPHLSMLEDGEELKQILTPPSTWEAADPELLDVVSPFHNFFSNRPLSSASERANIRAKEPEYYSQERTPPHKAPYILVSDTEDEGERIGVLNLSTDPFDSSADTRFAGQNRPLPDILMRSRDRRSLEEYDTSELDPAAPPRTSSELGGSMQLPQSARRSQPLHEVHRRVQMGPGGMKDASGYPISVHLQNEELPMEEDEALETDGSIYGPARILDDAILRKKKRIRPPQMLELKEQGHDNEPLWGMNTEREKDDLQNEDLSHKIHDERRQFGEEIDNEIEEDYHLDANAMSPYQELEQNFPTPVPKQTIKHRRTHTKHFSRSKSPRGTEGMHFYPADSPESDPRRTAVRFRVDDDIGASRNSSIIEQENVQFENSIYDRRASPIDQLQGHERTKYSKNVENSAFKPRPDVEHMRLSREGARLPPRGTDSHFFSTLRPTRAISQYPPELDGGYNSDRQRSETKMRDNYFQDNLRERPQLLPRPGREQKPASVGKTQYSWKDKRISSPYITSDSDSLAFKKIQQPASATKSDFNDDFQRRGRTQRRLGGYGSDDSEKGERGYISEAFYRPPEGPVAGQLFTKTKRTGGGYQYGTYFRASSQEDLRYGEGLMPMRSSYNRQPLSLSPPPQISQPKLPESRHLHNPSPNVDMDLMKEKVENWKKLGKKSKKKQRTIRTGPYQDISTAVNFMQAHYPHELKGAMRRVSQQGSFEEEGPLTSRGIHSQPPYQPRYPLGEKGTLNEIIHRAPQVLSQIKRKKRQQRDGLPKQYWEIDDEAMRKIEIYGGDRLANPLKRMRAEHSGMRTESEGGSDIERPDPQFLEVRGAADLRISGEQISSNSHRNPKLILDYNPAAVRKHFH